MVCEFPQRGFIHRRARTTMVFHRFVLGEHGGKSRVILSPNRFVGTAERGGRGESLSEHAGTFRPGRGRANGFVIRTEGGVMTARLVPSAVLAAVTSVILIGCNDGAATPTGSSASQSATTSSAASSPTPTPTKPLTPAEQDLADAERSISSYWRVLDDVASNPKTNLNVLATVARAQALAQWQSTMSDYRSKSWVQRGAAKVVDPTAVKKANRTFTVTACIDVTGVDVVDASGKSVVATGRPDRQQYTYEVQKAPQGFFVTVDRLKGKPCAA